MKAMALALGGALLAACASGTPHPAALDTRNDACASCRMAISNQKLAAQVVTPGEEPHFFDDIGCLAAYLHDHGVESRAAVFVADHRTGEWVGAQTAVFTRVDSVQTPMGSDVIAHADGRSRDADPMATRGRAVPAAELLGLTP